MPAIATAVACALVAIAGATMGAAAVVLAVPAAGVAVLIRLRIEARHAGLVTLSERDPLTGLENRRVLYERLGYEIARHRRHSRRFALLVLDLDGFKAVNDRFGHPAGDEILREVSRAMQKVVREQDTLVRIGGDEFCVLAPETAWQAADLLVDRLRHAVREGVGGVETLDVSIGYAVFPDDGWTAKALMAHADAQEIEIKRRSRARRRVQQAA
jgi:diguanylate cyclase (GGDEF)-like protein